MRLDPKLLLMAQYTKSQLALEYFVLLAIGHKPAAQVEALSLALARNQHLNDAHWLALFTKKPAAIQTNMLVHTPLNDTRITAALQAKKKTIHHFLFSSGRLANIADVLALEILQATYFTQEYAALWIFSGTYPIRFKQQIYNVAFPSRAQYPIQERRADEAVETVMYLHSKTSLLRTWTDSQATLGDLQYTLQLLEYVSDTLDTLGQDSWKTFLSMFPQWSGNIEELMQTVITLK